MENQRLFCQEPLGSRIRATGTNLTGNKEFNMKYITSLIMLLTASVCMAQSVPNTFSSGTPALASEVNANFADLDSRVNTNTSDGADLAAIVDDVIAFWRCASKEGS